MFLRTFRKLLSRFRRLCRYISDASKSMCSAFRTNRGTIKVARKTPETGGFDVNCRAGASSIESSKNASRNRGSGKESAEISAVHAHARWLSRKAIWRIWRSSSREELSDRFEFSFGEIKLLSPKRWRKYLRFRRGAEFRRNFIRRHVCHLKCEYLSLSLFACILARVRRPLSTAVCRTTRASRPCLFET